MKQKIHRLKKVYDCRLSSNTAAERKDDVIKHGAFNGFSWRESRNHQEINQLNQMYYYRVKIMIMDISKFSMAADSTQQGCKLWYSRLSPMTPVWRLSLHHTLLKNLLYRRMISDSLIEAKIVTITIIRLRCRNCAHYTLHRSCLLICRIAIIRLRSIWFIDDWWIKR